MAYDEADYLMLSGIQHYYYSKRQWSLIHLEQQWADNQFTIEGQILHEKADNPYIKEKRKDIFYSRAIPVSSRELGLSGIIDVIEFHKDNAGISLPNRIGKWIPRIVEFKRGKPKNDLRDIVQLVAQVICLEESFGIDIPISYIFYQQIKKRQTIEITENYRQLVKQLSNEMHRAFNEKNNVGLEEDPADKGDSLRGISLSYALKPERDMENYIFQHMEDDLL